MDDLLLPEDFDQTVVPDHPADLGRWLRMNGVREDIIDIICSEFAALAPNSVLVYIKVKMSKL